MGAMVRINRALGANIRAANKRNLEAAGRAVHTEIQRVLRRGGRSGHSYYVPGTQTRYTASAPGEAPANVTGTLAGSYEYQASDTRAVIGTSDKRGPMLEYGTQYIEPRPHVAPAVHRSMGRVESLLKRGDG